MNTVKTFIFNVTFCVTLTGLLTFPQLMYAGIVNTKEGFSQEKVEGDPDGQIAILSEKLSKGVLPSKLQELIDNEILVGLIGWKDNIKDIKLIDRWRDRVADSTLELVSRHFPNLIVLVLTKCQTVSDKGVKAIAEHYPNLRSLCLTECSNITDSSIVELANHCPNLRWLSLQDCNVSDISALQKLTKLAQLNISHTKITDVSSLKDLTNLTTLNLSNTRVSNISALQGLTELANLDLEYCSHLEDISALYGLPKLAVLNLYRIRYITYSTNTVCNLVRAIPSLRHLTLLDDAGDSAMTKVFDEDDLKRYRKD